MLKKKSLILILISLFLLISSLVFIVNDKIFKYSRINIEDRLLVVSQDMVDNRLIYIIENLKLDLDTYIRGSNIGDKYINKILADNIESIESDKAKLLMYRESLSYNKISNPSVMSIISNIESLQENILEVLDELKEIKKSDNIKIYLNKLDEITRLDKEISNYIKNYKIEVYK